MAKKPYIPPQSLEAEQATLGAMLLAQAAVWTAGEILTAGAFHREAHSRIFAAMQALCRRGDPIDFTTLPEELEKRGDLQLAGGRSYLASLLDVVPTAENVEYYARIVLAKSILREVASVATDVVEGACNDVEDAAEYVEQAAAKLALIARRGRQMPVLEIGQIVLESYAKLGAARRQAVDTSGLTTGIGRLDNYSDGLEPGYLAVLSGSSGSGKTMFATHIAIANVKKGVRTLYVALEMNEHAMTTRFLCNLAGVDLLGARRGRLNDEDWQRVNEASTRMSEFPLDLRAPETATVAQVLGMARDLKDLQLLIVDHLGLLRSSRRFNSRVEEEADRAEQLRQGAKQLGIAILAVAEHRKPSQERVGGQPTQFDLRGASELIDAAALIMMLHEPKPPERQEALQRVRMPRVIITKNRNGMLGSIQLRWDAWCGRFFEVSTGE